MPDVSKIKLPDSNTYNIKDTISGYITPDNLIAGTNISIVTDSEGNSTISSTGGSGVSYTAGDGIAISSDATISNTAPIWHGDEIGAGKVTTLFEDSAKTTELYPRTKTIAVSDSEGNSLGNVAVYNAINLDGTVNPFSDDLLRTTGGTMTGDLNISNGASVNFAVLDNVDLDTIMYQYIG